MKTLDKKENSRLFLWFAVFVIGIMTAYAFYFNTFGSAAPVMMSFFAIDNTMQGFIMTIQSIGGLVVAFYLALQGERFNKINVMFIGLLVLVMGVLNISLLPVYQSGTGAYPAMLAFSAVGGVGISVIGVMVNGLIPEVYPEKKDVILPLVHAFYGVACMVIPIIVTSAINETEPATFASPYLLITVMSVVILVFFGILGRKVTPHTIYSDMTEMKNRVRQNPAEIFKTGMAWVILAVNTLYFIFQIGVASWFPSFAINDTAVSYELAGYSCTAFFAGQLVMRFLVPVFLKKLSAEKCYIIFGFAGTAWMLAAFLVQDYSLVLAFAVIGGFFQGGLSVLLIMIANDIFPKRTASASALSTFACNIAALAGPYLVGAIADANGGSFRFAMLILVGCLAASSVVMIIFGIYLKKRKQNIVSASDEG